MDSNSALSLILGALTTFGESVGIILGASIVIGLGVLVFSVGWGYIRNMPGDWGYDSQRKSWRPGRGKSVEIPKGGRIF